MVAVMAALMSKLTASREAPEVENTREEDLGYWCQKILPLLIVATTKAAGKTSGF